MSQYNPDLLEVELADLRPTQMTAGFAEVALKRRQWRKAKSKDPTFLQQHCFPGVRGPKDHIFITDHHHLGLALLEEGVERVFVTISDDLSGTSKDEFWVIMDHLKLAHPYDLHGHRLPFEDMPKKLDKLTDDPDRSSAAQVKERGGYAKETEPFAEFLWADFLRRRIAASLLHKDEDQALKDALALCHSSDAAHLPGWSGPQKK